MIYELTWDKPIATNLISRFSLKNVSFPLFPPLFLANNHLIKKLVTSQATELKSGQNLDYNPRKVRTRQVLHCKESIVGNSRGIKGHLLYNHKREFEL